VSTNHSLTQLINVPTRITATSKSCLDLLFSDSPCLFLNSEVRSPIGGTDHTKKGYVKEFGDIMK
jgi:hypothetical protein